MTRRADFVMKTVISVTLGFNILERCALHFTLILEALFLFSELLLHHPQSHAKACRQEFGDDSNGIG